MQSPNFSLCCWHVIACEQCINCWLLDHSTCPHCDIAAAGSDFSDVRGIDEMLVAVCATRCETIPTTALPEPDALSGERESDSDFEIPAINFRSTST